MQPKPSPSEQPELFRSALANMVDPKHPLVRLARLIDWERFATAFGPLYRERVDRPGLPTHLSRPAPDQAHGRPVRRGGLRPLPGQLG